MTEKRFLPPKEFAPNCPKPPADRVEQAMEEVAATLADMSKFKTVGRQPADLIHKIGKQVCSCAAAEWAIYEHLKAGRIKIEVRSYERRIQGCDEGSDEPYNEVITEESYFVWPTPLLWNWWKKTERKRKWSVREAEPVIQAFLIRASKENRKISIRFAEKETSIPKSTIAKTEAWKALGTDARRHITHHTGLTENRATAPDDLEND